MGAVIESDHEHAAIGALPRSGGMPPLPFKKKNMKMKMMTMMIARVSASRRF